MATSEKPDLSKYRSRMDKTVAALKEEFGTLRTGRASAGLLDQVHVEAYGSRMPISQLGAVSVPEPRAINVSVWDKALVVSVEKAIRNSGLGLNPVVEGQNLRIPIPPLSEERRRDLVKTIKQMAEEARVRIRGHRRDGIDEAKKAQKGGDITEDDLRGLEKEVQDLTNKYVKKIDEAVASKEAEIMKV